MSIIIKYFALMISSLYVFNKILNLKTLKKTSVVTLCLIFSALMSGLMYVFRIYLAPISIIVMVCISVAFVFVIFKNGIRVSITASIISFAISFAAFLISAVFVSIIVWALKKFIFYALPEVLEFILIGSVQFLITTIPFKFKRLKNGMPFLLQHGNDDIGVFISISLLLAISFLGANDDPNLVYILPVLFILIAGLILWFWWRNRITRHYYEKVKAREIQELEYALSARDDTIQLLKQQSDEMAKIIHRDNKLIPAMELALQELLRSEELLPSADLIEKKAKTLLLQLEQSFQERQDVLSKYEKTNRSFPTTGIDSIDNLLLYMNKKASDLQINLDASFNGDLHKLVKQYISEKDIVTLLADLIENAIIAGKKSKEKRVFVFIGLKNGTYAIDIFDCGEEFSCNTLVNFGLIPASTHLDDGGSGLGLLSIYELAQNTNASVEIEEMEEGNLYSKRVSIIFDELKEYRIQTARAEEIVPLITRSDVILLTRHGKPDYSRQQTSHV